MTESELTNDYDSFALKLESLCYMQNRLYPVGTFASISLTEVRPNCEIRNDIRNQSFTIPLAANNVHII